jgi:ribonucleoside-diphosphate reductase alpha chain
MNAELEQYRNFGSIPSKERVGQYTFSVNGRSGQPVFEVDGKPQLEKPGSLSKEIRDRLKEIGRDIPPVPQDWPEPELTENGRLRARKDYLRRISENELIETEKEMFFRVAHNIAVPDIIYRGQKGFEETREEFYHTLANLEFVPNTPTLANAGCELQQLSACFVLPIEDDLASISKTLYDTIMIHKTGGGTGFSFSSLRPQGAVIKSTGRESSGPVHFMWAYSDITYRIKQGGLRRGANMGVMNITHPDVLGWIAIKSDEHMVNPFNLSLAVTNEFMEQVARDSQFAPEGLGPHQKEVDRLVREIQEALLIPYFDNCVEAFEGCVAKLEELVVATQPGEGYELVFGGQVWKRYNARKVSDLIARLAWEKGDPGVIYTDRINEDNPTPQLGRIEATNPCGEQPLLPYESCNLGAINLAKMVTDGKIDFEKMGRVIRTGVHFLDNVIDMNQFPQPEIEEMTLGNRKIGLGLMGFADMLVQLGIPYDSESAEAIAEKIGIFLRDEARKVSQELAEERGVFPNFDGSIYDPESPHYKGLSLKVRNAAITTIAPTGTTSMLADVGSGIEPFYALRYKKNTVKGDVWVLNPYFVEIAKREGFWSEDLISKVEANCGSVKGLSEVPQHIQELFPTAPDISPEWHIRIQAAFQRHIDNAISKTINMLNSATPEDIQKAYRLAFELGCKGVTTYRDGSRDVQILERGKKLVAPLSLRERPDYVPGGTFSRRTPVGMLFVTVNTDLDGYPLEAFLQIGKGRTDINADAEAIGRLISAYLRSLPREQSWQALEIIIDQLSGIGGGSDPETIGPNKVLSLPDGVSKALRSFLEQHRGDISTKADEDDNNGNNGRVRTAKVGDFCPQCKQATLIHEEGCMKCPCGYTKC